MGEMRRSFNAGHTGARRTLPSDIGAEARVLSAMLLSGEVVEEALVDLMPDDFYRPSHKVIFSAMSAMYDDAIPVDRVTLVDRLTSDGKLGAAGGEDYVRDLMGDTLALADWQHNAEIVRRHAMLRGIIGASNQIGAMAYGTPIGTKELIDRAESMLLSVTDRVDKSSYRSLHGLAIEARAEAEEISDLGGEVHGAPTGFPTLDDMLLGLREGQLIVIGARPAVGKTAFSLNLALNAAVAGYTVGFFSLEMSGKEIAQRLMCAKAMVNMTGMRTGKLSDAEMADLEAAMADLNKLDILVDDTPGTTVTEIRAKARRMIHKKEKAVIILDYLQLVNPPEGKNYNGSRAVEVSEMSRGLKIMAKELGVPVIVLSQLNRSLEGRAGKRPQMSDLRESGSIEQDADIVMLLDRSSTQAEGELEGRPPYGITRVILAKNRSGPVGDVDLLFMATSCKFYEMSEQTGEEF